MLAWSRGQGGDPPGVDPCEQERRAAEEGRARAAKAACEAQVEQVKCELKLARLRREDLECIEAQRQEREEKKEEKKREEEKAERIAHEDTVRAWRQVEAQQRKERLEARRERWKCFCDGWHRRRDSLQGQSGTLRVLVALGIPALGALLIYALSQPAASGEILAIGLLTAAATFAAGAILGFLFGIPRSVAATPAPTAPPPAAQAGADDNGTAAAEVAAAQHFAPNTNLEQISDWLTKILVGVGLVQIHQVNGAIENLADGLAPGLGSQGKTVAVALLISFSITGFASAYLYTRLRLQRAFEQALTIERAVKERADTETTAIALVQQQLSPGTEHPSLNTLTEGLKAATSGIRSQAFFMARAQRLEKLNDEEANDAEKEEFSRLCIPVFEALIACDPEGRYHRNRAELGFALIERLPPDFTTAKAMLDEAIRLRKSTEVSQTPSYELKRAYCTIALEPKEGPSVDPVIEAVCIDIETGLRAWAKLDEGRRKEIEAWLERNSKAEGSPQKRAAKLLASLKKLTA